MNSRKTLYLLTGATGLVGRFVLAQLLRCGVDIAVLVREHGSASGVERIEEALAPFESHANLGRPRIISGDLTCPGLGIGEADLTWLRQFEICVIHSAASIRFIAESLDGEPYRSNVRGTTNLLAVLQTQNVSSFHYISTAYVSCRKHLPAPLGHKQPPLVESQLGTEIRGGNDYECSKITAEQLLYDCEWVGTKTIFRPSIIVGSSSDGYTSSFHGFYAPLQIGYQLIESFGFDGEVGAWFRNELGLKESDSKNFVPVDWVAEAIVKIVLQERLHGQIYHLTNPQPVSCAEIQKAIINSLKANCDPANSSTRLSSGELPTQSTKVLQQFSERMSAYRSYFSDDPQFDCSNTQQALPDLPCPRVGSALLEKLADYSLEANFGWPRKPLAPAWWADIGSKLRCLPISEPKSIESTLDLKLIGPYACEPLRFVIGKNGWCRADRSNGMRPDMTVIVKTEHFASCITGASDFFKLIEGGQIAITGELMAEGVDLVLNWLQDLKLQISRASVLEL